MTEIVNWGIGSSSGWQFHAGQHEKIRRDRRQGVEGAAAKLEARVEDATRSGTWPWLG